MPQPFLHTSGNDGIRPSNETAGPDHRPTASEATKPVHILDINASPVSATLKPAGLDISKDIISTNYGKDPGDPQWKDSPA